MPPGKYGIIMGNVVEVPGDIEDKPVPPVPVNMAPAKSKNFSSEVDTTEVKKVDPIREKPGKFDAPAKWASKKKRQTNTVPELLIKKEGSYTDEIFALQKENEVIGQ